MHDDEHGADSRQTIPPHTGQSPIKLRTGLIEHMNLDVASALTHLIESRQIYLLQLRSIGGAVNDISPKETAHTHRTQNLFVSAFGDAPQRHTPDTLWETLTPHLSGLYINFESDTSLERVRDAYPSPVFEHLQRLKREYDPENILNQNFNIPPATD